MTQSTALQISPAEDAHLAVLRPFFDARYYSQFAPNEPPENLLLHYLRDGWRQGFDPSRRFSSAGYLAANPDVAAAKINPLLHYVQHGRAEGRALSVPGTGTEPSIVPDADSLARDIAIIRPVFDTSFYLRSNADVAKAKLDPVTHFCQNGWRENRDPHPQFSVAGYLSKHPTLRANGQNPFAHFLRAGGDLAAADTEKAVTKSSQGGRAEQEASGYTSPVLHRYFDTANYRAQHPRGADLYDPVMDFTENPQPPSPHPQFDTAYYLRENPDLADLTEPAFLHYLRQGHAEGRAPNAAERPSSSGPAMTPLRSQEEAERRIRFGILMKESQTDNTALGQLHAQPWPQCFAQLDTVARAAMMGKTDPLAPLLSTELAQRVAADIGVACDTQSARHRVAFGQLLQVESLLIWLGAKLAQVPDATLKQYVHIEGHDLLKAAQKTGRPILLLNTHVGPSWSVISLLSRIGPPLLNLAAAPQSVAFGPNYSHTTIPTAFPAAALATAAKAFTQGPGIVHILPDVWEANGRSTAFLGRKRSYAEGFCYLAHRFQPIMLTLAGQHHSDGHLTITIGKEMGEVPSGPDKETVYATLISRLNAWVETLWVQRLGDVATSHLQSFLDAPLMADDRNQGHR